MDNSGKIPLKSLDYVRLIAWLAYFKFRIILNKTQMQKLLFICYGLSAAKNKIMFPDDTPKAWPFGPVFPRSYKNYDETVPADLSENDKKRFAEEPDILRIVSYVVDNFHSYSATRLSEWSHRQGGPWFKTVFPEGGRTAWNREISTDEIKNYFSDNRWLREI